MGFRTLLALRNKVRDYIDEKDEARWGDTELDGYINLAYKELVNDISNARTGFYEKSGTVTTVANNKIAALPDDFAGTITALQDEDNSPITYRDKRAFNLNGALEYGTPENYSFFGGNSIWLYKIPDAIYNFPIDYEYMPEDLYVESTIVNEGGSETIPANEIVFPAGEEKLIIWQTVVDCKLKDHQELQILNGLLERKKRKMLLGLRPRQTFRNARARCLYTERNQI